MTGIRYPSKRDRWLLILLWASLALLGFGAAVVILSPEPPASKALFTALIVAVGWLVVSITAATWYELGPTDLLVRCGPFSWRVPLAAIREVVPSRNPLSGPALSLDRLHVRYDGSRLGVLISPEPRAAFLEELAARAGLARDGDRLVRR